MRFDKLAKERLHRHGEGEGEIEGSFIESREIARTEQENREETTERPREGSPRPSRSASLAGSAELDVYYKITLVKTANAGYAKMDQTCFFSARLIASGVNYSKKNFLLFKFHYNILIPI